MIYLYLLIIDYLENPNQHSLEETTWIYLFLVILIIGFILSYYTIVCSIYCVKNSELYKKNIKDSFGFGGLKKNISPSRSKNYKKMRFSKFAI